MTHDSFFGATVSRSLDANFLVLGIPLDFSSTYRFGSSKGPQSIRKATSNKLYNHYTEALIDIKEKWKIFDGGDIKIEALNPIETRQIVLKNLKLILDENLFSRFLFLGGDHLSTYFTFYSLLKIGVFDEKRVGLIYLDAHPDLYEHYEGNHYSHACVVKRIISDTDINAKNIVQIGVRASTTSQMEFAEKEEISIITTKEFQKLGPLESAKNVGNKFKEKVDIIYLSIDLDVLDPAFAPGLGNPETGGLTTREIIDFIQTLAGLPIIAFDIVELCPDHDQSMITAFAAAKIIKETLGIIPLKI
ncbi:MAG: agmatinase [Candidatus Hodarchaeota archaeon]